MNETFGENNNLREDKHKEVHQKLVRKRRDKIEADIREFGDAVHNMIRA